MQVVRRDLRQELGQVKRRFDHGRNHQRIVTQPQLDGRILPQSDLVSQRFGDPQSQAIAPLLHTSFHVASPGCIYIEDTSCRGICQAHQLIPIRVVFRSRIALSCFPMPSRDSSTPSVISALSVHLVMAADIEQDDLSVRHLNREDDAVVVCDADGLDILQLAAKVVVFQVRLERIAFQIAQTCANFAAQFRDALRKNFLPGA